MRVVISQSMYFPWIGILEQIKCADRFVHYDDVQFTRGFFNRVEVKTSSGMRWLTVPCVNHKQHERIDAIVMDERRNWRKSHRDILRECYRSAPHVDDMLAIVDEVLGLQTDSLAELCRSSMRALARYFEVDSGTEFFDAGALGIHGRGSQRLLDITRALDGDLYVTGHGARNYLDHELFEHNGIAVEYMDYKCIPYPQPHPPFVPYVTSLDLVANCGRGGVAHIASNSIPWRRFVNEPN